MLSGIGLVGSLASHIVIDGSSSSLKDIWLPIGEDLLRHDICNGDSSGDVVGDRNLREER